MPIDAQARRVACFVRSCEVTMFHDMQPYIAHSSGRIDRNVNRRRAIAALGVSLAGGGLLSPGASAQEQGFPSHPLRMIVAYPPGGATDILARTIAAKLTEKLGQAIVIDNRPGAGSTIGMDAAASLPPDGYNLYLCAVTTQAIASHLYPKSRSDLARDFVPVSLVASAPHVLVVNDNVPAKNMAEFISWIKAQGGTANYASQGNGTLSHLESELLCQRLSVKATHVAYKGSSPAITDLLAGLVSFMFDSVASSLPLIKAGKLRAIAVASSQPVPAMPGLPTISQSGIPGYQVDNWFGIYAPRGTPPEPVSVLAGATSAILRESAVIEGLVQRGYIVTPGDGGRLAAAAADDYARWGKVIKSSNIAI
ncbi:MAG: tripartite tricarboxylate transporter substrate binding protein [Proteobacteria bacterium]|nr:tripartite tricarboxylate transporter substrate binding protein [Pseudomonadota bacterium]